MFNFLKKIIHKDVEEITNKIPEEEPISKEENIGPEEAVSEPLDKEEISDKEIKDEKFEEEKKSIESENHTNDEDKTDELSSDEEKEEIPKKKGFFGKIRDSITTKKITSEMFDSMFENLEISLLENNVAYEVAEKIKTDLSEALVEKSLPKREIKGLITNTMKESITEALSIESYDLIDTIKNSEKRPYIICFFGINGSGKTTSIAKLAHLLMKNNLSVVLGAADTFRAAAIDQLAEHAKKLNTKIIKYDYGADSAAVAFESIKYAKAHNNDVVLIDTAGRLNSNVNLMQELKKIIRVAKPDLKIFVGESITGNDCIEQAEGFENAIGFDGIILTKADTDEKGGTAISLTYLLKKPILYIGTGQTYDDFVRFTPKLVIDSIF